jgi:hypothetical protein
MVHVDERGTVLKRDTVLELLPSHSPYHLKVRGITAAKPTTVVIDQFYYPGMRVLVNGRRLNTAEITDRLGNDGRMVVVLPASSNVVLEGYYDGPPGWRLHLMAITLWFVTLGLIVIYLWRKTALMPPPPQRC